MFSAISSLSNPFGIPRFLQRRSGAAIEINPVAVHDVETNQEKRARTLKHLLKLNHANHAILYHHLQFHNHTAHVRSSLFVESSEAELMQYSRFLDLLIF